MTDAQFGAFLRERRLEANLNLRGVAAQIGVSKQHLSDVELGHRAASERVLWGLARVLELDVFALHALTGRIPNGCVPATYERAELAGAAFRQSSRCGPRNPCQKAPTSFSGHSE